MKTLRLPIPPSVNAAYGNNKSGRGRGRYKTSAYKAWLKSADAYVFLDMRPMAVKSTRGPFDARIRLPKVRGDIDNRIKVCLDYLVSRQLVDDDSLARKVSIEVDPTLGRVAWCEVDISNAD